jgi:hypothetical protein
LGLYLQDKDVEFLRTLHASATAHLNYTLARLDADGDFLLEHRSYLAGGSTPLEDVGFNAMFAIDMASLSMLCVELRLPIDALYWYQGMLTISRQLVRVSYDAKSGAFHSYDNQSARRDASIQPLSALPTFFRSATGDNVANAVTRNYVLRGRDQSGATPYDAATSSPAFVDTEAARRLAALATLSVVDANGYDDAALGFAGRVRNPVGGDYAPYFECLLQNEGYRTFIPRTVELHVLSGIAARSGLIDREVVTQLDAAIHHIETHLSTRRSVEPVAYADADGLEQSVRRVYMTLSEMRGWWRKHELFTPVDRRRIPGFDANAAFDMLATQTITLLRQIETDISRARSSALGFDVTAVLKSDQVAPGSPIRYRIGLSSLISPIGVKSVHVLCQQKREAIQESDEPVVVRPGSGREYEFSFKPRSAPMSTLIPVEMTVDVALADGRRLQYHFHHGVFISPPVTFEVVFPRGDTALGGSLPVALQIDKHVEKSVRVNTEWFSPSGLRLKEGKSLEVTIPQDEKRIEVPLTILLPANARPGAFPFVFKLFESAQERGTIRSSLFKHYNWLFLGPLPDNGGLTGEHPPERGINLLATYPGLDGNINWATLPQRMYEVSGRVNMAEALPTHSVGYLYTAIKSEWELQTSVTLASQSPAMLLVNGDPILAVGPDEVGTFKNSNIVLQPGLNNILIKVAAAEQRNMFMQIGDGDNMAGDEFGNNLYELVDGYAEFVERSRNQFAATDANRLVTLTYSNPKANSVAVIGSFNGWSPVDTSMRKATGGTWEISLHLPPGRYAYRLLIDNDEQILDPSNSIQEPDGYGGMNSILFVR